MEKDFFTSAFPSPNLNMEQSLGVNLLTNIQLTDYFLNNNHTSERLANISRELPKSAIEALHVLRTVFAHGVILREFYMMKHHHLNEDWDQFITWWKEMPEDKVLELVNYGIRETMNYYYRFLPQVHAVEETMQDVSLKEEALKDPANRQKAIKAVLQSWQVESVENALAFYEDLNHVKETIIHLIESFWMSGFKQIWEEERKYLSEWQQKSESLLTRTYRTNEEALMEVTGSSPDTNEMDNIKRAQNMTFIPVLNLDRLFIFYSVDQHMYVMFEPSQDHPAAGSPKPSDFTAVSPAFEGMGDQTRLQIIGLLAENREMFAQQIVTTLDIKQSTVSRHLNQLEQSRLVSVRRVGNTKYFSINSDEIRQVINVLETFIT